MAKRRDSTGFTIIEVMIVLAIAALILLIVLLAVPALQRNSRNTAIKNDAASVIGGISEFKSSNAGRLPSGGGASRSTYDNNGTITLNSSSSTPVEVKIQKSDKVYIRLLDGNTAKTTPQAGWLWIAFQTKCPDTVSGQSVSPVKSYQSASVIYAVETNSKLLAKCVDG